MKHFLAILICISFVFINCSRDNTRNNIIPIGEAYLQINEDEENISNFQSAFNLDLEANRELVFPARINVVYQNTAFGPVSNSVMIWGWSLDGKVAFSTDNTMSEFSPHSNFVVFDLISNNVVFESRMDFFLHEVEDSGIWDTDWNRDTVLFDSNITIILNALETYGIIDKQSELLRFPLTRDGIVYDIQVIDIEHGDDSLDHSILSYSLLITTNNKKNVIDNLIPPPRGLVGEVFVAGYFLSPFENRIVIVVAELSWFQHGHRGLRFISSYLESDFE